MDNFKIEKQIKFGDSIHLYLLDVDRNSSIYSELIPKNQLIEITKYKKKNDRDKRLLARSFLFGFLNKNYGITNFELVYNEYEKPFLKVFPNINFSFSYSNNYVFIAISIKKLIGIDIEHINRELRINNIASEIMSSSEIAQFNSFDNNSINKYDYFFQLFSAKESIIKAFGTGLYFDIKSINLADSYHFIYNGRNFICEKLGLWKNQYFLSICYEQTSLNVISSGPEQIS